MKTDFVNTACRMGLIILLLACNNNDTITTNSTDSTEVKADADTIPIETIYQEAETDYTKRDINLTQQQWESFKRKYKVTADEFTANDKITGDFNGDGKKETIYIVPSVADTVTKDAFQECIGGCNSHLVSPDTTFPVLIVYNNLGGEIKNIEDVDGDGADDIMVYPSWWQSNWNAYMVYSLNRTTRQWSYLVAPVTIFANELEKNIPFVKKAKQGDSLYAYTTITDEDGNFHSQYKLFKIIK